MNKDGTKEFCRIVDNYPKELMGKYLPSKGIGSFLVKVVPKAIAPQ